MHKNAMKRREKERGQRKKKRKGGNEGGWERGKEGGRQKGGRKGGKKGGKIEERISLFSWVSDAVINSKIKSNMGRKAFLHLTCPGPQSITESTQRRNSRGNRGRNHGGKLLSELLPSLYSTTFLVPA